VDCLVLRTGSCSVAKSRGNSYAPVGVRNMMMMMMIPKVLTIIITTTNTTLHYYQWHDLKTVKKQ